jgi:hypothetical protein
MRRDYHRLIAGSPQRADKSLAEVGDVPVAVRGKNDGPRRGRLRQALSNWK